MIKKLWWRIRWWFIKTRCPYCGTKLRIGITMFGDEIGQCQKCEVEWHAYGPLI